MAWIYLIFAGLFEIGWPIGMKISQVDNPSAGRVTLGLTIAVVCMAISGFLLWVAQKSIPVGTAYAIWTGIGAVGTFVIGIVFFRDPASMWRMISVSFIIIGIIGLKLSHT